MITDPIADCFARIRNSYAAGHDTVKLSYSKMKESIVALLKKEGLVSDFEVLKQGNHQDILVRLRYEESGRPMIQKIRRRSKPSHRIYRKAPTSLEVRSGLGFQILSTSKGVMTDKEAIEKKVGGELIAELW